MASSREPNQLRQGREFHRLVQVDWARNAEGDTVPERPCTKPTGRRGRIDVFVDDDDSVSVVEIKHTDWDRMKPAAVRRNARRYARQLWQYIDSQLQGLGEDKVRDVCPGIIFPNRPVDANRLKLIEELFDAEGIPVVWEDETREGRKAR